MKKVFFAGTFVLTLCLCLSFTEKKEIERTTHPGYLREEYDQSLVTKIQSVDDLVEFADSAIGYNNRQSPRYAEFLASTLRKRFYHGYSYYDPSDNWIAWMSGKLFWNHLNAIVIPDDILKHPNAACSQQAIVLSACFKFIGIPYREVDLNGHFVLEGKIEGKWYYFDTNLEPKFVDRRKSLNELVSSNELFPSYANRPDKTDLESVFSSISYMPENAPIATKAKLFHRVTSFLSIAILLLIPTSAFVFYKQNKR